MRFLDMDRLLYNFREIAKLSTQGAEVCGGWEDPSWAFRGHSVGHYLSGASLAIASTNDPKLRRNVAYLVRELRKCQTNATSAGYMPGYIGAFPQDSFFRMSKGEYNVAWYTMHKLLAGLLDAHRLAESEEALVVMLDLAAWSDWYSGTRTYEEMQTDLNIEFGGMNEVMADLYLLTGEERWLNVARRFDHKAVYDPLAAGVDSLNGLHANTQMAKMMGALKEYEACGEQRYLDIVRNYWDIVVGHHTYATGGDSEGEHYFGADQISFRLSHSTCEVCNVYNMLKISRELFLINPDEPKYIEYYEWALYNQILAHQDPTSKHGRVAYYLDMRPGGAKVYDDDYNTFWCDTGTSLETFSKLNDSIYFHAGKSLYVNLFVPSVLSWSTTGLTIRQDTCFPLSDKTTLSISGEAQATIYVRIPAWAASPQLKVNNIALAVVPGSYAKIERTWFQGDRIELRLPMKLSITSTPDDPAVQSVSIGPVVLAGQFGPFYQGGGLGGPPWASPTALDELPEIVAESVTATSQPLQFRARMIGGGWVDLKPYFDTHNQYATVYWQNPQRSGYVRLRNKYSGRMVSIGSAAVAYGSRLVQSVDCRGGNEHWEMVPDGVFVRFVNRASGCTIGVGDKSGKAGAAIVARPNRTSTDTQWRLRDYGGGWCKIVNRIGRKVLSVGGAAKDEGLIQDADTTSDMQLWQVVPEGLFRLRNVASNRILAVEGGSGEDGARVIQWLNSGTPDHGWTAERESIGPLAFRNLNSGRLLSVRDCSQEAGAQAIQLSDSGAACQLWAMAFTGRSSEFRIINANSGLALTVPGLSTSPGEVCVQSDVGSGTGQVWRLG